MYAHTFVEMWRRWFPAWRRTDLGLYDRLVEGESYYTHAPLVPLVSLIIAVLLVRHTKVPARPRRLAGGLVLGGSLLAHLAACYARVNFVSGFSLIGVLAGLVLLFWGWTALRRLWFPLALLLFMVPLPEVFIAQINFRLKFLAAAGGVGLANLVGIVAERSGNQVFLEGDKALVIANICNGLRTLISLLAFGALYAYVCKLRGGWRLGLFLLSVPVAIVANAVRILSLLVVADTWDVKTATGWYHDTSGLFIYPLAFLLMFSLERLVLWARRAVGRPAEVRPLFGGAQRGPEDEGQWPRLTAALRTGPVLPAAAAVVLTAGATWWLGRAAPSAWNHGMLQTALPVNLEFGDGRWHGYDMELDPNTLTVLEWPDYLMRQYVCAAGDRPPVDFCVIFSKDNRKGTHPPDLCLEGGGQEIIHAADVATDVAGRGRVPCRELIVQLGNDRHYYLYFYKCGDRYTRSFYVQQFIILANGLLSRDASGALVRVSTPAGADPAAARARAEGLLGAAVPYLDRAFGAPGG
jgi:EpsI family protein